MAEVLKVYRGARGVLPPKEAFFRSRAKKALSRGAIYERVRKYSRQAKIPKRVSPHTLRHTFATHLVKQGTQPVAIRDLLGHRQITSSQVYFHVTAEELRQTMERHPVSRLAARLASLLPSVKLPFQHPPKRVTQRETG